MNDKALRDEQAEKGRGSKDLPHAAGLKTERDHLLDRLEITKSKISSRRKLFCEEKAEKRLFQHCVFDSVASTDLAG
jgi:hypothetical protein